MKETFEEWLQRFWKAASGKFEHPNGMLLSDNEIIQAFGLGLMDYYNEGRTPEETVEIIR